MIHYRRRLLTDFDHWLTPAQGSLADVLQFPNVSVTGKSPLIDAQRLFVPLRLETRQAQMEIVAPPHDARGFLGGDYEGINGMLARR